MPESTSIVLKSPNTMYRSEIYLNCLIGILIYLRGWLRWCQQNWKWGPFFSLELIYLPRDGPAPWICAALLSRMKPGAICSFWTGAGRLMLKQNRETIRSFTHNIFLDWNIISRKVLNTAGLPAFVATCLWLWLSVQAEQYNAWLNRIEEGGYLKTGNLSEKIRRNRSTKVEMRFKKLSTIVDIR